MTELDPMIQLFLHPITESGAINGVSILFYAIPVIIIYTYYKEGL